MIIWQKIRDIDFLRLKRRPNRLTLRIILVVTLLITDFDASVFGSEIEKRTLLLMGSVFELTAVAQTKAIAIEAVDKGIEEIKRIENLISEWDPASETSMINRMAGLHPVKVQPELFALISRSLKISRLTQGAFDISFASMDRIWNFDRHEHALPDSAIVRKAASKINWQNIQLNAENTTVFLTEEGMKIGFGAIGKGYAANRAKLIMQNISGLTGGIVNASGDLTAWGESNHTDGWSVQIANPDVKKKNLGWIRLNNMSIVTSGNYEKYFTFNGMRYAHIINPNNGYPVTGIKSVTVICPDAELADALATSIAVLGIEEGINLANKLNGVECLIIDQNNTIYTSDNMQLNYYE
jgi:thiamine biosynthesis lipoprotein